MFFSTFIFDFQVEDLLEIPEYRNFTWIGSGLQKHFGHITIAKQDVNHSVPARKSSQLFEQVILLDRKLLHIVSLDFKLHSIH